MAFDTLNLRLAAQTAMLWNVTASIRAVNLWANGNKLYVNIFYDGKKSSSDDKAMSSILESIMDTCIESFQGQEQELHFDLNKIRLDAPARIPYRGEVVYHRFEP